MSGGPDQWIRWNDGQYGRHERWGPWPSAWMPAPRQATPGAIDKSNSYSYTKALQQ
jgi:hypothetical protein